MKFIMSEDEKTIVNLELVTKISVRNLNFSEGGSSVIENFSEGGLEVAASFPNGGRDVVLKKFKSHDKAQNLLAAKEYLAELFKMLDSEKF